jgi:hypothetical protein
MFPVCQRCMFDHELRLTLSPPPFSPHRGGERLFRNVRVERRDKDVFLLRVSAIP